MSRILALLSLLHEQADVHSGTRLFRGEPVLRWTLRRLARCQLLDGVTLFCWADQQDAVRTAVAGDENVTVRSHGERFALPHLSAMAVARTWADGWRGGLLGSCEFDLGYHAEWARQHADESDADALLLVDPAAGLVDPALIDDLIEHAEAQPTAELCFSPAPPGASGTLLRRSLVDRLPVAQMHPGRLLTYWPDHHGVDPIGKNGCAPIPTPLARSCSRFKLDSHRQITRADAATADLNGQLIRTNATDLVDRLRRSAADDLLPRDIVLELNTRRLTKPIYSAGSTLHLDRGELPLRAARTLFAELAAYDDVRVTLAGCGDPLLAEHFFDILTAAEAAGVKTVGLETDLLTDDAAVIDRLAAAPVQVISVHFPAATAATYERVMGVHGFGRVMENFTRLERAVQQNGRGFPLLVPTLTKTRANLGEIDGWYDYWIRRLGHAVVVGPSDFAGQTHDVSVADMAPPQRRPCARLQSRLTILCDGSIVSCEQDVLGRQALGTVGDSAISDVWQNRFGALRQCHADGRWNEQPLCGSCREWHRP